LFAAEADLKEDDDDDDVDEGYWDPDIDGTTCGIGATNDGGDLNCADPSVCVWKEVEEIEEEEVEEIEEVDVDVWCDDDDDEELVEEDDVRFCNCCSFNFCIFKTHGF